MGPFSLGPSGEGKQMPPMGTVLYSVLALVGPLDFRLLQNSVLTLCICSVNVGYYYFVTIVVVVIVRITYRDTTVC